MQWEALTEGARLAHLYSRITKSTAPVSSSDLGAAGKLVAEQADEFMIVAIQKAQILKDVRLQMMRAETAYISEILFSAPALFPVLEGVALSADLHSKPVFQGPLLSAKLHRAVFQLTDQAVRESITGDSLLNYMMDGGGQAVGRDMEKIFLNGDTSITSSVPAQLQLSGLDGIRKQSTTHQYDNASGTISDDVFDQVLQLLPPQFFDVSQLKFYTSHLVGLQYRRYLANRMTPGGDRYREDHGPLEYGGIEIVPLMLLDQNHGGSGSTTNKCTDVILSNPFNFTLGVRDEVMIEFARNARAQVTDIIFSTKFDQKIGVPDAEVIGLNIKVQP